MNIKHQISEPFIFNPLKHHLGFIREFTSGRIEEQSDINTLIKELKHIGTSVMDVYTGDIPVNGIAEEADLFLRTRGLISAGIFAEWSGTKDNDYRIISLSDDSQWALKYHNHEERFVHFFPARQSPHSFRVKANTLKSAILYYVLIGKDYINSDDLNKARAFMGLSPVKDPVEAEAITEMIEILRIQ